MFKNLFSWWHEDILLKDALGKSRDALDRATGMVSFAMQILLEHSGEGEKIYKMDAEVNRLQVDVRKKIMEHLAVNPAQDVMASLVLTTIIVDLERIGDFAKNIVELDRMCVRKLGGSKYNKEARLITGELDVSLGKTGAAFTEGDPDSAENLMGTFTQIGRRCDSMLEVLVGDEGVSVREAVIYGLLFRYLKRIACHARNICSSVVNPFHRLGYKPD